MECGLGQSEGNMEGDHNPCRSGGQEDVDPDASETPLMNQTSGNRTPTTRTPCPPPTSAKATVAGSVAFDLGDLLEAMDLPSYQFQRNFVPTP